MGTPRQAANPSPAKPSSIIVQVEGSGTVDPEIEVIKTFPVTAWKLMEFKPRRESVREPFVEANKSWL